VSASATTIYRFYYHTAHPEFRLVLRGGDPFPSETVAHAWTHSLDRQEHEVAFQVKEEIARRGYSLFKFGLTFADIPS
jgi:hypothetical protein